MGDSIEIDPEGKAFGERGGGRFILQALIERDKADARRPNQRQTISLQRDLAPIERNTETRGDRFAHPLRHRDCDDTAVGVGQHAGLGNWFAGPQGCSDIETPNQPIVGDFSRHSDELAWREFGGELLNQCVARRPDARTDEQA